MKPPLRLRTHAPPQLGYSSCTRSGICLLSQFSLYVAVTYLLWYFHMAIACCYYMLLRFFLIGSLLLFTVIAVRVFDALLCLSELFCMVLIVVFVCHRRVVILIVVVVRFRSIYCFLFLWQSIIQGRTDVIRVSPGVACMTLRSRGILYRGLEGLKSSIL